MLQRVDSARERLSEVMDLEQLASTQDDFGDMSSDLDVAAKLVADIEAATLFVNEEDERPAVCHLRAGQGGTEACDWVAMLLRMYGRWAPTEGLRLEVMSAAQGSAAGYSEALFVVEGHHAHGWMRSEHGVHRLARVSPHGRKGLVHTSFASMDVSPLVVDTGEVADLARGEVRIDTYRGSGPGGQHRNVRDTAVRATHLPTGVVASCERSQHRNKERALQLLASRVQTFEDERGRQASNVRRADQRPASFGSQVRSYTLHPHRTVVDHRTGCRSTNTEVVLNGNLRFLMQAWLLSARGRAQASP